MTPAPPVFIGSEVFRTSRHAPGHPLAIPRVSVATDLCRALDWLPDGAFIESSCADPGAIARFHAPDYVDAVVRAERDGGLSEAERQRYNLGINGNPIYGEIFRRPATACGASLLAATRLIDRPGVIYNPAGGTHHGQADRASGFCVFNDPVLAILALLDGGLRRVFYLDLDAHFGDGVQAAFHDDERVFTLSIHEAGRWPMSRTDSSFAPGGRRDRAGGAARNCPVPPGFNDSELAFLMDAVVLPEIDGFAPEALIVQAGCDALADDPMSKLALSNRALWRAVDAVRGVVPRLLVLGGGGYNPFAVARCWAGIWAVLSGQAVPERLPMAAERVLRDVRWSHRRGRTPPDHWLVTLADSPNSGAVRPEVRDLARDP